MASASYHSQCGAASASTMAIMASGIAGKSTMKAQKMKACIRPGTSRWSSLRWPRTTTASSRRRSGTSSRRSIPDACPIRTSRAEEQDAAGEEEAGDGEGDDQRESADHPLTRRSSAVIAGTISSTSPITA